MKIFKLFEENDPYKVEKSLEILGLTDIDNKDYILNEISKYLFVQNSAIHSTNQNERIFDINLDYEYYFPDFLMYSINLNKDDIDWWEFDKILNAIFLNKNSNMHQIIEYRTYEKPPKNIKTQEEKEHKYKMQMKRKYALPSPHNTENGFEKMWSYVEKKAGEIKE